MVVPLRRAARHLRHPAVAAHRARPLRRRQRGGHRNRGAGGSVRGRRPHVRPRRSGRQDGARAQPHAAGHLQPGFRPGGSGPRGGQPHGVRDRLRRETAVLHRRPPGVYGRRALVLLLPPHRGAAAGARGGRLCGLSGGGHDPRRGQADGAARHGPVDRRPGRPHRPRGRTDLHLRARHGQRPREPPHELRRRPRAAAVRGGGVHLRRHPHRRPSRLRCHRSTLRGADPRRVQRGSRLHPPPEGRGLRGHRKRRVQPRRK